MHTLRGGSRLVQGHTTSSVRSRHVLYSAAGGRRASTGPTAAAAAVPASMTAAAAAAVRRTTWCRAAEGDASSLDQPSPAPPPPQQAADTTSSSSSSSSSFGFTEPQLRQLWDSVTRSLLKLGKSGMSDTHINSLKELLAAHKLVKVDLNGARDDAAVLAAAAQLGQQVEGAGEVVQVKGRTLLIASSGCSSEELLAVAEASTAGTALWKVKRQAKKAEAASKREEVAARKQGRSSKA